MRADPRGTRQGLMPQAIQSLPYVAWILLTSLAFGSFAFVAVTKSRTDATRGYLGFTAVCAGLLALLALLVDWSLTVPTDLVIKPGAGADLRQMGLVLFAIATLLYPIGLRRSSTLLLA